MLCAVQDGKVTYQEAKARLCQVINDYSDELVGLECPFSSSWNLFDYFDTVDFEKYGRSHSDDTLDVDAITNGKKIRLDF